MSPRRRITHTSQKERNNAQVNTNDLMKPTPPEGYSTPALDEAKSLLSETEAEHDALTARHADLVRSLDAARDAHATAGRAYGASPTAANKKTRMAAAATIEDFELQIVSVEEEIEELAPTLVSVRAEVARLESEALEAYRAAERARKEALAEAFARQIADTIESTPADVIALAKFAAPLRARLLEVLGV